MGPDPQTPDWQELRAVIATVGESLLTVFVPAIERVQAVARPLSARVSAGKALAEMRARKLRLDDQRFRLTTRLRYARTLRLATAYDNEVLLPAVPYVVLTRLL